MANLDNPHGATIADRVRRLHTYLKGTNAAIYPGDFVKMGADGKVIVATAASEELLGVAQGYASASNTTVCVADHPDQLFYLQDDGASGTLAATAVGGNVDIVATAGNTTLLKSLHEADTSSLTSATAQLRIVGKHPEDSWGDNVRVLVRINEHHHTKLAGL